MVRYNTAVMALLKRMGPRTDRGLGQLPDSLLRDLTRTTHSMLARFSFCWESEKTHKAREAQAEEIVASNDVTHLDRIPEAHRVSLAAQIPCILLFLQLAPPRVHTGCASILSRFALFSIPVRGRSPQVNALFTAVILHLLPRPYATVPTINLILSVITVGATRIADEEAEKLMRRKLASRIPKWVLEQNAEVEACLAGLPRWLQALVPKGATLDFAEIIDEIARRLPPADEGLPGDYVDVLAARTDREAAKYEYGVALKVMYNESTANTVTPAELSMLVPKLLDFSVKFDRMRVAAQMAQNVQLLDFSPPVNRETVYSAYACTALRGALSNLSLLRHTEKILAVRELSPFEWLFIISIVTGREKAWAPTAYTAMRAALRIAEERRRDEIKRSGKAERDVSLFEYMDTKRRLMLLAHYSTGLCELRFNHDLFSAALECTEPLMREYLRALEADTTPSLRTLDAKYRIRQMLSVVTRADNVNVSHVGEESEDVADENDVTAELAGADEARTTTGKTTHSLLRALEKFFTEPSSACSSAAVAPATPVPEKRGSGFARTNLPDQQCGAAVALEGPQFDELILRMHVVECAIVYCLQLHEQRASCHGASSELVELSLRSARRMQRIVGVQLQNVSSVIRSSQWKSQAAGVAGGLSSDTTTETVIVDGAMGEYKSLQLSWVTMKLLLALTQRKDMSAAARADVACIAAAFMSDFAIFMDSIGDHRVLPTTVNRNIAMLHRWYVGHKNMLKSSAVAEDAPPFRDADESARKVALSCLGVAQRILPPRHHQRRLAGVESGLSFGFHRKLVVVRAFDSALSFALTANMTLDELPNIFDLMEKTVDTIREASLMALQESPSDTERYKAEKKLRSSLLPKLMHLLHHICILSINDESCLTVAAAALDACAREDQIAFLSWKKRESILSTTLYVYRALAERFAHSRASRDVAHQLLIMVSRLALSRLEYEDSEFTAQKEKRRLSESELELRHLVCAVLMWQISCAVASTFLQSAPLDKYLRVMHTYVKRHFVISMSAQAMEESSMVGTEAELEYCEQVLAESGPSARSPTYWGPTTTKEEMILRCNLAIREVFLAMKFLATVLYKDSSASGSQAFRMRWVSQMELACGLLKQYQRWIAPSVWYSIWRELVAISVVMRIGHVNSLPVQETTEVTAQRLLTFSKIRDNKGVWIDLRGPHAAASQGEGGADEGTSAANRHARGKSELISFSDASRIFQVQDRLTDVNLRVYLAQLTDRLSREQEQHALSQADSGANLEGERRIRLNGLSETEAEIHARHLRAARISILFTCRRMRS
ncbi:hypothetical protein conserved [Leishmania donovani]|uniref:Hypothetical_protein_conserved n=1 Tax=Leishmania donovani TaxID=5661 RepID=A0A6J8FTV6_LEIDO|nr:hypothetical protein conserved [Leishmania donovani]VDZ49774.1 hypothetical_protein_conserved [Leishmania donovani]